MSSTATSAIRAVLYLSATLLCVCTSAYVGVPTASAEQPDKDYPTDMVLLRVANAKIPAESVIRIGFYDGDIDQGFGYDKAYHKHKFEGLGGMAFVLRSPLVEAKNDDEGIGFRFTAYFDEKVCRGLVEKIFDECDTTRQERVLAITNTQNFPVYYGWPAGNPVGLQTVYCPDQVSRFCPPFVTAASKSIS